MPLLPYMRRTSSGLYYAVLTGLSIFVFAMSESRAIRDNLLFLLFTYNFLSLVDPFLGSSCFPVPPHIHI